MTPSNPQSEAARRDEAAAEWAVRLSKGALSETEQSALDASLAADPSFAGALLRARAAWVDIDRLVALAGPRVVSSKLSTAALDSDRDLPPASASLPLIRPWATPAVRSTRHFASAASILIAAMACIGLWWQSGHANVYVSHVGEIRRVELSDGSHMTLNSATSAAVHFDQHLRQIELGSGEGLFQVAKDPHRPFVVHAGSISVRAVGTIFSVRADNRQVDVTVTEGVVELLDDRALGDPIIRRVSANTHATVLEERQIEVTPISHEVAERKLAWRDGLVDFSGERLASAVAEINRHNDRHIVIDDPVLAERPVVGVFRADDPQGFAKAVAIALGATSLGRADAIHLRSSNAP